MADTAFRSDSALTAKKWSAYMFKEAMGNLWFGRFVGTTDTSIVQRKDDLFKETGDVIHFPLRMQLTGLGRTDDQDLEGYEEPLVIHDFAATIHRRMNAVKSKGKMSRRRVKFDIMMEAKSALADWMSTLIDNDTILTLSGLANPAIVDDDGAVIAAVAPSTSRIWIGGQAIGGSLDHVNSTAGTNTVHDDLTDSADNLFGTLVISAVKRKAQLATPRIRPIKIDGGDYYLMLIHPYQAKALKAETAWISAQQTANIRGSRNPIFSGALGMWDGVVIHESDKITTRQGDSTGYNSGAGDPSSYFDAWDNDVIPNGYDVARALFLGAQAAVHAYGQFPSWMTKDFQYGTQPGVATDVIYVAQKTKWNSEDFGVIAVDTVIDVD